MSVRWSSWSFLVYAGALTLALSGAFWFDYLSSKTGHTGDLGWALLIAAVLLGLAEAFRRNGHRVTAGALAFGGVLAVAASVAQLFDVVGWNVDQGVKGFDLARLAFALAWIGAAALALRRYRFPLIVLELVYGSFFFLVDLLSNGGTWTAVVSILLGLTSLAVAAALDAMGERPYAFWVHVGAGLMIGGGALWCVHSGGAFSWALIAAAGVAYVWVARALGRSSWAVLGALGIFISATYFALRWTHVSLLFFDNGHGSHPWAAPLTYSLAAALVLALGLWAARRPATA